MPKNKGLGGKKRRRGRGGITAPKELIYKGDGQQYAQIVKSVGNGYMDVMCFEDDRKIVRRAHICGRMRKRIWITVGDIVLVNIRNYQESTCDIVLKYTADEVRILRMKQQLPNDLNSGKTDSIATGEVFKFEDSNSDISDDETDYCDDDMQSQDTKPKSKVSKQNRILDLPPGYSDEENENSEIDDEIDNL